MNHKTINPSPSVDRFAVASKIDPDAVRLAPKNDSPRCRNYTVHGRQCRLRVLETRSGFCFRHAKPQPAQSDTDDLSADLLGELSEFESASEINKFLAKLLVLVTKGRVSPRRASVLAYITNQLLHSHRAIDREIDQEPVTIIMDGPRPDRSQNGEYSPAIQRT
jgi:hypothetical protein